MYYLLYLLLFKDGHVNDFSLQLTPSTVGCTKFTPIFSSTAIFEKSNELKRTIKNQF